MPESLTDLQDALIRTFDGLTDWMDRYEYLIGRAGKLGPMDPALKTEEHAISGCQSHVWIAAELHDGTVRYQADSDAQITRGLLALILGVLDGQTPAAISHADLYFIDRIGLTAHLSPSRANGFVSILNRMKQLAAGLCES